MSKKMKLKQARRRLMETFKDIIAKRRNGEENPDDFLQTMLKRDLYPANEKLDDEEIMDNLLTLIIAGQTTTAAAMMWSVKFLNDHKEVQDRLRVRSHAINVVALILFRSYIHPLNSWLLVFV